MQYSLSIIVAYANNKDQLRNTSGMVEVSTTAIIDEVEKEVLLSPRRHRRHGRCESAESLAAFKIAWTGTEDARHFLRAHPWNRTA